MNTAIRTTAENQTAIRIDKGVPIPPQRDGRGNPKYPWAAMEVGDSFFVPADRQRGITSVPNKKHAPKKWTSRMVVENGVKGLRIWRFA
jgi:hypothetical protein